MTPFFPTALQTDAKQDPAFPQLRAKLGCHLHTRLHIPGSWNELQDALRSAAFSSSEGEGEHLFLANQ